MTENVKKSGYEQNDRSKIKPMGGCRAKDKEDRKFNTFDVHFF